MATSPTLFLLFHIPLQANTDAYKKDTSSYMINCLFGDTMP